jgi:rubrerythrin
MATLLTPAELVGLAVETEKGGRRFYAAAAAATGAPAVKDLFNYLATEEARHERVFADLHDKLKAQPAELPYDWDETSSYLRVITDSRYFLSPHSPLVQSAANVKSAGELLEIALQFEKETLLFYLELVQVVGPAHRGVLAELVGQERQHIRKLDHLRREVH